MTGVRKKGRWQPIRNDPKTNTSSIVSRRSYTSSLLHSLHPYYYVSPENNWLLSLCSADYQLVTRWPPSTENQITTMPILQRPVQHNSLCSKCQETKTRWCHARWTFNLFPFFNAHRWEKKVRVLLPWRLACIHINMLAPLVTNACSWKVSRTTKKDKRRRGEMSESWPPISMQMMAEADNRTEPTRWHRHPSPSLPLS